MMRRKINPKPLSAPSNADLTLDIPIVDFFKNKEKIGEWQKLIFFSIFMDKKYNQITDALRLHFEKLVC